MLDWQSPWGVEDLIYKAHPPTAQVALSHRRMENPWPEYPQCGELFDPVINTANGTAKVWATFVGSVRWRTMLFLDLKRVGGRWVILRLEWDMG